MPVNIPLDKLLYSKGGVTLRDVPVDTAAVERAIGGIQRQMVVIEQHPVPGLTVVKGTPIDIVLANADTLPVDIFPGLPGVWKGRLIGGVAEATRSDPKMLDILEKHDTATTLTAP